MHIAYVPSSVTREVRSLFKGPLDQSGQDLLEYALVLCLVALGSTAGMRTLANGINTASSNVSARLLVAINTGNGGSPGQSGSAPGQTGGTPGQSGNTPGQGGSSPPGQGGTTPGQGGGAPGRG